MNGEESFFTAMKECSLWAEDSFPLLECVWDPPVSGLAGRGIKLILISGRASQSSLDLCLLHSSGEAGLFIKYDE